MCERWPHLDCHPYREFTDHLAISPSTHTRSLGDILSLCWGEQGEVDSPKPGRVDSSSACEEGARLLGDKQKWAASSQAGWNLARKDFKSLFPSASARIEILFRVQPPVIQSAYVTGIDRPLKGIYLAISCVSFPQCLERQALFKKGWGELMESIAEAEK